MKKWRDEKITKEKKNKKRKNKNKILKSKGGGLRKQCELPAPMKEDGFNALCVLAKLHH